jgi:GNAT superfamily N-acetyltransferase
MNSPLDIAELTTDTQIAAAFPVATVLRPHLQPDTFLQQVRAQQREGYHLIAGQDAGRLVALAGYRLTTTLFRGAHLFVDDLVTLPTEQGKGHATALLKHLAQLAAASGMTRIWLDSRNTAKTYYEKVGFTMHTSIPCSIEVTHLK